MNLRKALRASTAATLGAGLVVALGLSPLTPTATAATTYWTFDNAVRGCLESTASGSVFETACVSGDPSQDWYWIGTADSGGRRMLASRISGRCLMTDIESGTTHANAVWTSFTCDSGAPGQRWSFDYGDEFEAFGNFKNGLGTSLRTSPGAGRAVYSDRLQEDSTWYYWSTSLTS
ncbi:hypothetical protein [Promicromonospora sp. NPDC023805]|uniref:hypothetical protein n=1 Tax=Promicromonospora sp. NPDC023805 TaxID=3154696 RepID=UPI0033FB10B0